MINYKNWKVKNVFILLGLLLLIWLIIYPLIWMGLSKVLPQCGHTSGSAIGSYALNCECKGVKLPTSWIGQSIGNSTPLFCLGKCGTCSKSAPIGGVEIDPGL